MGQVHHQPKGLQMRSTVSATRACGWFEDEGEAVQGAISRHIISYDTHTIPDGSDRSSHLSELLFVVRVESGWQS